MAAETLDKILYHFALNVSFILIAMDRGGPIYYSPYFGKTHPRNLSFERSVIDNPVEVNFYAHVGRARQVLEEYRLRAHPEDAWEEYQYRPWFWSLPSILDEIVEAFIDYRRMNMNFAAYEQYRRVAAALETVCSIIIFSNHPLYRESTDEDLEQLQFPLSKSTRLVVSKIVIGGEDIKIKTMGAKS